MFPSYITLLFIGWFLIAQPFAIPLDANDKPEIRTIPSAQQTAPTAEPHLDSKVEIRTVPSTQETASIAAESLATRTLLSYTTQRWRRNCNGANGGDGGSASGAGAVGGNGGDGGTCNETAGSDLSGGAIAGIVIGALAGICTIVGGGYKFVKWVRERNKK